MLPAFAPACAAAVTATCPLPFAMVTAVGEAVNAALDDDPLVPAAATGQLGV